MYSSVNTIWVLVGAALVFFMQAGFAMRGAGFTTGQEHRQHPHEEPDGLLHRHAPLLAALGFGLMFGRRRGLDRQALTRWSWGITTPCSAGRRAACWPTLIFQTVFCATAATIVSGAMAERTKFSAYCIYMPLPFRLIIYPDFRPLDLGRRLAGTDLGFHDFAGSTAVHMVGGVAACIGATDPGPPDWQIRQGRQAPGHPGPQPDCCVPLVCSSCGSAGLVSTDASTVCHDPGRTIVLVRAESSSTPTCLLPWPRCTTMIFTWLRYKKPDVSMTMNAALAGLVAVTAGCDAVTPSCGAAIIGLALPASLLARCS